MPFFGTNRIVSGSSFAVSESQVLRRFFLFA